MLTDQQREARIEELGRQIVTAETMLERSRLWREMRNLIAQRSPRQVAAMEHEKGLR
jgi:hypothetical protein